MSPPDSSGTAPTAGADTAPESTAAAAADTPIVSELSDRLTSSQQVSWWSVHEFVARQLASAPPFPAAGTPAWCLLADDDPAKIAALLDAAQHHVLRVETAQQATCEASRAISAAADWKAIGQEKFLLECARADGDYYIPRVKGSNPDER